ncbi:hypothetical protein [Streptomyces sp. NPDC001970]
MVSEPFAYRSCVLDIRGQGTGRTAHEQCFHPDPGDLLLLAERAEPYRIAATAGTSSAQLRHHDRGTR